MWSRWACETNQVGVLMNDQGWAPRSNPSFSSGTRQYVCTAAREYPSSVRPLCSIVRTGALSTGWSSDSTVMSMPMSDANTASRLIVPLPRGSNRPL